MNSFKNMLQNKIDPFFEPSLLNMKHYLNFVYNVKILSQQEEMRLALILYVTGDIKAAQELIIPHLRFVIKIAKGFLGYGLSLADLIQEGNIGLMKAVKKFDPHKGVRLVSFAFYWIKAEIYDFIIKNWSIVKIASTKNQKKLFFNLRKSKKFFVSLNDEEIKEIAINLNVKKNEIIEMEKRLELPDLSTNDSNSNDYNNQIIYNNKNCIIVDNRLNPEETTIFEKQKLYIKNILKSALKFLDPRSIDIINSRWLIEKQITLKELAKKYHISPERIRQIEISAMKILKNRIGNIDI
jgi:RNA polymerase sigma-32 factor